MSEANLESALARVADDLSSAADAIREEAWSGESGRKHRRAAADAALGIIDAECLNENPADPGGGTGRE